MVCIDNAWVKLNSLSFYGNSHHRDLRWIEYCKSKPHRLNVTMSRALNKKGKWETWFLVSNLTFKARKAAEEYAHRFGCEEGFRDTKWWAGFKEAKVKDIEAWSRLFGFFVITGSVLVDLGTKLF